MPARGYPPRLTSRILFFGNSSALNVGGLMYLVRPGSEDL